MNSMGQNMERVMPFVERTEKIYVGKCDVRENVYCSVRGLFILCYCELI